VIASLFERMSYDLRLKAVVFKDARGHGERLLAELIPVDDPAGNQRNSRGQVTYFSSAATFMARLDRAGLQETVYAEIRKALASVLRTRGIALRIEGILLDREQVSALGFQAK
jgi:hypothetical protein